MGGGPSLARGVGFSPGGKVDSFGNRELTKKGGRGKEKGINKITGKRKKTRGSPSK